MRKPRNRLAIGAGVVAAALAVAALLWVCLAPSLNRTRDYAGPVACASNLRRIGDGILVYAKANRGRFPDHFGSLLAHGVDPADFVCPCSGHAPATRSTTGAVAESLAAGTYGSYSYVGKGLDYTATSDIAIAYEMPVNHGGGKGMNVLFADGHTEMFHGVHADRVYAGLQAGRVRPWSQPAR